MSSEYIVNGKRYTRLEDMPEEERRIFEQFQSGHPFDADAMEQQFLAEHPDSKVVRQTSSQIVVNGKKVTSADDVPEDIRKAMLDSGMFADKDDDGIPDILQGHPDAVVPSSSDHPDFHQNSSASTHSAATRPAGKPASIRSEDEALKRRQNITNLVIIIALIILGLFVFFSGSDLPQ